MGESRIGTERLAATHNGCLHGAHGPPATQEAENVVEERAVRAADIEEVARAAGQADWPLWARSYRVLDLEGQELAHVFKLG
jgi:hypothetical protein